MTTITKSFYITGGTLQRDAECYVKRQADIDLLEKLREGKFCYVLTSRQMGKSSLMVRAATTLRSEKITVIVLDLTAIGQNLTPEQWYDGLLNQVSEQLGLEDELDDFWFDNKQLGPLQRWMTTLTKIVLDYRKGQIVIFIDEIDVVRSLPFSTDEFFAGIRELYNRRTENKELERLTFCLLGAATPADLIRDVRTTPFNIGQRIELKDFSTTEALPLANGLGRDEALNKELLERILYWTSGHPYLTQKFCSEVAQNLEIKDTLAIDKLCDELFLSQRAKEKDDNLIFVRERILRSEVDLVDLLELYKRIHKNKHVKDDNTNHLINVLLLSGIAKVETGRLRVRNCIYSTVFDQQWILSCMPDAELRRQRKALIRGFLIATCISVVILSIILYLWLDSRYQRKIAEEQREIAEERQNNYRQLLYASQLNLAYQAWDNSNIGGVLEILNRTGEKDLKDLRSFEWFYLNKICNSDLATLDNKKQVWSVVISPDGKMLAAGDVEGYITLWDMESRQKIINFKLHTNTITSMVFSADSKILISGSYDKTARLWILPHKKK